MAIQVLVHIQNSDPVLGEMDEMPDSSTQLIKVTNPRHRDGKDLDFLAMDVVTVFWPVVRLTYIEILPSEDEEQVIGFVRE